MSVLVCAVDVITECILVLRHCVGSYVNNCAVVVSHSV